MHVELSQCPDGRAPSGRNITRGDAIDTGGCATAVRRFAGPIADELAILCRPSGDASEPAAQAEAVYRTLTAQLAATRASCRDLASETLFLRDIRRDLPIVLAVRDRVLAEGGSNTGARLPAAIQQAPLDPAARFELAVSAVIPRDRDAWSVRDVPALPACACEACRQSAARIMRNAVQTSLSTTHLYGRGRDVLEQASDMFREAQRLLERCAMDFGDVVRTWVYLRDIDRDYDALNRARRAFFQHHQVELRPASTGIEGVPFPDAHACAMRVDALRAAHRLDISPMATPLLNEAWSYGADFSRGLRIAEQNKLALYVSGTASIDAAGRTAHVGDFTAQADRMLRNIASLLDQHGAAFADVVSGVAYLKHASDAAAFRSLLPRHGFAGFPLALLEAKLCRPDLLCETEVVAMLPLAPAAA